MNISFWEYLIDRLTSANKIKYLPDLISGKNRLIILIFPEIIEMLQSSVISEFIMLFKMVKIGDRMPPFQLLNQDGKAIDITKYLGNPLIIYFYPKDDTVVCTRQACGFRDEYLSFSSEGAVIFGISADSVVSHKKFRTKYNLPFDLLSDKDNKVRDRFGVPSDLFGLIPGRVTYIVDRQGIIRHIYNNQMNSKKHIEESLRILKSF